MSFTTSSFVGKLAKLSDSQQSIQTLSHWVQYHKSSCNESAVTWAQECLRAPPARHLLYVYLANDIMQNSKRKGNEFCNAYGAQLPAVLPKMYAGASEEVKSKMLKVVNIWEERRVLDSSLLNELRDADAQNGAPRSVPLMELLISLDQGSLVDELQAEREVDLDLPALTAAASGETDPSETVAAKAAAATQLLNAHRAKIAEELAARRKLILLLAGSIESQHEQCAALKTALASCESMLATAARAAAM